MKKFAKHLLLFCFPFAVYMLFIVIIDPYNLFGVSNIIDNSIKVKAMNGSETSVTRGNMLWKTQLFKRNLPSKIIIGDSDGYHIREDLIYEITGEEYFNYSVSGATIETQIDMFWYAVDNANIEKIYFQFSFELSNMNQSYSLFHFAEDYLHNPFKYFTNRDILLDSYRLLIASLQKNPEFKDYTYQQGTGIELSERHSVTFNRLFSSYEYPVPMFDELERIVKYCRENGVVFEFIIFSVSDATNTFIVDNGYAQVRNRFYNELKALGPTHDFLLSYVDNGSIDNFPDLVHSNQEITDEMTCKIWTYK